MQEKASSVKVVPLDGPLLVTPDNAQRMRSRVVQLGSGEETGEHVTSMREELLVPLEGTATLVGPEGAIDLAPGQAAYIPEGTRHNVVNRTDGPIRYMYVLALHADYETVKRHAH